VVFIITTFLFACLGIVMRFYYNLENIGIYYYFSLCVSCVIMYFVLPRLLTYVSNILLFYTVVVIFCFTLYTAESESLHPNGLIFVLALVAGLNHSFIYITVCMIIISVMGYLLFTFLRMKDDLSDKTVGTYNRTFNTVVWVLCCIVWSSYVYIQEYEKKS